MGKTFSLNWLRSDLTRNLSNLDLDMNIVDKALLVAFRYHDGQFRENRKEGTRIPYITHPVGVAKICAELWPSVQLEESLEDILSAALTHDLLEDTAIEPSELEAATSPRVAELVDILTKPSSSEFLDRSERNRVFLQQIQEGGTVTRFLKVCDALHNLSRPEYMPLTLLKKTIRKARRDYLPLTLDDRIGNNVRDRLEVAIGRAEQHRDSLDGHVSNYTLLESFFTYCIVRASGKVLEPHDIQDIILELKGTSAIATGSLSDFLHDFVAEFLKERGEKGISKTRERLIEKGELSVRGKPFDIELTKELPFQKVFCLPISANIAGPDNRQYIFIGINENNTEEWVSVASLRAVVSILTERAREQEARELSDYADWVSAANLQIDPRSAAQLQLGRERIFDLARLLDAASIEISSILAAMKLLASENTEKYGILVIEGRVKSALSAARKLTTRADGDLSKLEDIVGIRVVTINCTSAKALIKQLKDDIADKGSVWNIDIGVIPKTFKIRRISTVHGYAAEHITFKVHSAYRGENEVTCEIQLRTIFQDAWARIAHEIDYKSNERLSKTSKKQLKVLSEICVRADEIVDKI